MSAQKCEDRHVAVVENKSLICLLKAFGFAEVAISKDVKVKKYTRITTQCFDSVQTVYFHLIPKEAVASLTKEMLFK